MWKQSVAEAMPENENILYGSYKNNLCCEHVTQDFLVEVICVYDPGI